MGRKLGPYLPFFGGSWAPSNTMLFGPRPTSMLSGILMQPAVGVTTDMGRKLGGF